LKHHLSAHDRDEFVNKGHNRLLLWRNNEDIFAIIPSTYISSFLTLVPEEWNGDWTLPPNFAKGSLEFRAQIREMPTSQNLTLQLCIWQANEEGQWGLENCANRGALVGNGPVVTWSDTVEELWKKNGKPIEWDRERRQYGVVMRDIDGTAINSCTENINEIYDYWFPHYMDFTAVVVGEGETFSGWGTYFD
jgi:hypothetical protein